MERLAALEEELNRLRFENERLKSSNIPTVKCTQVFECPHEAPTDSLMSKRSVLLCGPIHSDNWQAKTIKKLNGADLIIFNPRRADECRLQACDLKWEITAFEQCTACAFWISWDHPNITTTLLELGRAITQKEFIFVGIHPNNEHKKMIQQYIRTYMPQLRISSSIEKLENQIKYWIIHNSLAKANSTSSSEGESL